MTKALQTDLTKHPVMHAVNQLDSPASKRKMLGALRAVLALAADVDPSEVSEAAVFEFGWPALTADKLSALKAAALKRKSKQTAAGYLWAVRAVMGACFDLGMIDGDTLARIERVKGVKVPRQKVNITRRRITLGEVAALSRACGADGSPAGLRDEAILALAFLQGPRVSELSKFKLSDYDPETGALAVRKGKGDKDRLLGIGGQAKPTLARWIAVRGSEPGRLFVPVNKGGGIDRKGRLSEQAINDILRKRSKEAATKAATVHDFRATAVTEAIRKHGLRAAQRMAGHADPATTAGYDLAPQSEILEIAAGQEWVSFREAA